MTADASACAPIGEARLRGALTGLRLGDRFEIHDSIGSTNDRARQIGREGGGDGALVIAGEQTRGRGRRGRTWRSGPGGLYVSVLLRPPNFDTVYAASVQLAAGIAVAEALAPLLPASPELLWPNDCLCGGAKVAGVLAEAEGSAGGVDFLVCGIGVNVNQSADDLGGELAGVAASVRSLTGESADATELLVSLLRSLDRWESLAREGDDRAVRERWRELSPSAAGHDVELETVDGPLRGRSAGLGGSGGLLVERDGVVQEVLLGELIRVRRRS